MGKVDDLDGGRRPQGQDAAVPSHPAIVGVLEGVATAVHAGALAVPHPEDAVVRGLGEDVGQLAAEHDGRSQVLVDAGDEAHVVFLQERRVALQRLIEPAERRAAVARDHGGRVEAAALVGAALIQRQAHERLDSGQEDLSVELAILGVEREVVLDSHGPLDRGTAVA